MSLFDFNYYYGESSANSWLDKALPTLSGVVIGFILNRGYDHLKERAEIKKAGQEFINESELFKEPLAKQIKSLEELITKLNNPISTDANLVGNIPVDTDRITSINRLHVYKFFKRLTKGDAKEARRVVNKLYGTLKVCSMEAEKMKNLFENFTKNRRAEVKKFNASLNFLLGNFSNLITELEKQGNTPKDDKLHNTLLPIFTILYEQSANLNVDELVKQVSTPLAHITAEFRHDDRTIVFSTNNRDCFSYYREYLDIKREFLNEIENIKSTLSKLNEQLISQLEIYSVKV
jgi:hypothetical protein